MASQTILPDVPVKHADFISHVTSHPNTPLPELLEPFKAYDAKLREVFAQEPEHPALNDDHLNIVPIFSGREQELKIRARDLESESQEEKERYVLSLDEKDRRANGSPAVVESLDEFRQNFSLFSESSLVDLDWSNVVAAGSSVVTSLLPVSDKYKKSKRALRAYYHEILAPASDVDLFLYGLSEQDAIKKIVEIEQRIKDSILTETTTIRTKNAITIASQYPTRHVQIVLRIYKSVSEILTGFDVDCSCAAYDGKQVWASPRALAAYMTQVNTIDLTRRSPSYESRLSKYSHRGFEVHWPLLERTRIDPTIFERNFARTVGLARLLVLERLPTKSEREKYMDERRRERGRPVVNRRPYYPSKDNIKDKYEDEVAEWVDQDDVSDYHTFTIPYGPKYFARKIEKLLYTKDLLLNSEWNRKDDREVDLHRHPAFFGFAEDVIHDCCGFCPKPVTPEEHDVAEEESKIYVSGEISFIKDDAGRQAIGSFHPITDDDWTEMAYVGNTARLCQAIVDKDLDHVEDWLAQQDSDPNCRDYTGRTPLHLAVMSSTPEIVRTLIEHGARLVARLADGRTALHLAAARGNVEMVKLIMQKSEANEEEEANKDDAKKQARIAAREGKDGQMEDADAEDSDIAMVDREDHVSDDGVHSVTTASFVNVKEANKTEDLITEEKEDEPDVYDVNVVAWDTKASPLHLAILNGHVDVVKTLVQDFGADVLLPIKLVNKDKSPQGAILTLVLSVYLPLEQAKLMTKTLLELGASCAQADMKQTTALHYIAIQQPELIDTLLKHDEPAAKRAINHLAVHEARWLPRVESALLSAIHKRKTLAALKLLESGAAPTIEIKSWMKAIDTGSETKNRVGNSTDMTTQFEDNTDQPVVLAIRNEMPAVAIRLLETGVDPNVLLASTRAGIMNPSWSNYNSQTLLDVVRKKINDLKHYEDEAEPYKHVPRVKDGVDYLADLEWGSYHYFFAKTLLDFAKAADESDLRSEEDRMKFHRERKGVEEKQEVVNAMIREFEKLEAVLIEKGAKTFQELFPEKYKMHEPQNQFSRPFPYKPSPPTVYSPELAYNRVYTNEDREAYTKIFQAAWDGDLETIQAYTMAAWGPDNATPLPIAITDKACNSPFSLAVLRGHYELARAIVNICFAQYQPPEEDRPKRYRIAEEDEENSECDGSDVGVLEQMADNKFTIENVELSEQVKSTCTPLQFIKFDCPAHKYMEMFHPDKEFTYGLNGRKIDTSSNHYDLQTWSIVANDKALFSFMLDLEIEWTDKMNEKPEEPYTIPIFSLDKFKGAVKHGRIELLAEMIKHSGAGMALEALAKKGGIKYQEKPKYYQGLSVHGKKRKDWISAARGTRESVDSVTIPPLLQSALNGSLQSVEWFMSDTPQRLYLDFAEAYKHDKFISHLNKSPGGFPKVLRKWLSARRELTLHCAIMADPSDETIKIINYLLQAMPDSLEKKNVDGLTPLALAISLHRLDATKILIAAGADQTARDKDGCNILHLLLVSPYTYLNLVDTQALKSFLSLLDPRLHASLLTERCSLDPGSLTPLAIWLRRSYSIDCLDVILEFASKANNNEHFECLDATGNTPLHHLVQRKDHAALKMCLEYRPDLLHHENSTGNTLLELAADIYTLDCVAHAPNVLTSYHIFFISVRDQRPTTFAKDLAQNVEKSSPAAIYRLCKSYSNEADGAQDGQVAGRKRKLVSLIEANEVAKRLAGRSKASGTRKKRGSRKSDKDGSVDGSVSSGDEAEEAGRDEVRLLYSDAQRCEMNRRQLWGPGLGPGGYYASFGMNYS